MSPTTDERRIVENPVRARAAFKDRPVLPACLVTALKPFNLFGSGFNYRSLPPQCDGGFGSSITEPQEFIEGSHLAL
jgi:hypothetical protein